LADVFLKLFQNNLIQHFLAPAPPGPDRGVWPPLHTDVYQVISQHLAPCRSVGSFLRGARRCVEIFNFLKLTQSRPELSQSPKASHCPPLPQLPSFPSLPELAQSTPGPRRARPVLSQSFPKLPRHLPRFSLPRLWHMLTLRAPDFVSFILCSCWFWKTEIGFSRLISLLMVQAWFCQV